MNTQHTPTPWKADILQPIVWSGPAGDDGLREIIARTDDTVFTHGTDVANAAFIVRACNAYDDLVLALRQIAVYVGVNEMTVAPTRPVAPYKMQEIARAALAKAGDA